MRVNGVAMIVDNKTNCCDIRPVNLEYTDTDSKLESIYKLLDCELIDIQYFYINDKEYIVYLDDEGKLKTPWVVTGALRDDQERICDILAGSYLVTRQNDEEEFLELSKDEINMVGAYMHREFIAAIAEVQRIREGKQ